MPKAYSEDMRTRVIVEVESGAWQRTAAEELDQAVAKCPPSASRNNSNVAF